jgi:hypothetical protein
MSEQLTYRCRVEKHSIGPAPVPEVETYVVRFPRIVLDEWNTHRVFNRNTSSSRAQPTKDMIEKVLGSPFLAAIAANKKGMQPGDAMTDAEQREYTADSERLLTGATAAFCRKWSGRAHKQWINRHLQPWSWSTVIVTATDYQNFFALRTHPAAQEEIRTIARTMYVAHRASKPQNIAYGSWHVPFWQPERDDLWLEANWSQISDAVRHFPLIGGAENYISQPDLARCLVSAGRCRRVSYETHDGVRDPFDDLRGAITLASERPVHASPFEHQCCPAHPLHANRPELRSSLAGYVQFRKLIKSERCESFIPPDEEYNRWVAEYSKYLE